MTTLRFHGSAAVLLLPLALFVAVTARLFISEAAFDLTGLAAAGVLTLFSGSRPNTGRPPCAGPRPS